MNKNICISLMILAAAAPCAAARDMTLSPGELPARLAAEAAQIGNRLTLAGEAYASDLTSLKYLPQSVTELDMSALTVRGFRLEGNGYYGQREFADGEIPSYMLLGTSVRQVLLPTGTSRIGEGAFAGSALTAITLPATVQSIGRNIFNGCAELRSADLSATSLTEIPDYAFAGCRALGTASLPSAIARVGERAFAGTSLTDIELPVAKEIGAYAFSNITSLTSASYPADCMAGEGAFFGDTSLSLADGASAAPLTYALSGASQLAVAISSRRIGDGAYAGSRLAYVSLSPAVQEVGSLAFADIPTLGRIDAIQCGDAIPAASADAFLNTDTEKTTLMVRIGTEDAWRAAPVWNRFNIEGAVSSFEEQISASSIKITRRGAVVSVSAPQPLELVEAFGTDGVLLGSCAGGTQCTLDIPEGTPAVVVRAMCAGTVKIAKLL